MSKCNREELDLMEIISTWKNPAYPKKTMMIVRDEKWGLRIHDGQSILGMEDTFMEYERVLYGTGWRKVPTNSG